MSGPRADVSALPGPSTAPASELERWLERFVRDPDFLARYPYYAAILARLHPVADPSVKRMAVSLYDGRFYLHVNVDAFVREPQYLRGVLLHEVHHVAPGHLTHPKFAEPAHPELMELAVEMSANEYIEEPLPPAITWRAYAAYGVRAGQSTWERYERLVSSVEKTGQRPVPDRSEAGAQNVDDHRFQSRGKASPGAATQAAMLVTHAIDDVRDDRESGDRREGPDADFPGAFRIAGQTPDTILEMLTGERRAPEAPLDWRAALRMFVARARAPVHTWSRPNRRFPGRVFEVPGRTWATRPSDRPRLLVAVDTSLSMTRDELEEIARHLAILGERAQVTVVECDAAIARVYPFAGHIDAVAGRGGTDLRPVFAPAFLGAHDADGVVYFTDGQGPCPEAPAPVPTLWILTKPDAFTCPWGERALLTRKGVPPAAPSKPKRGVSRG